ncbi:hypothetical protein [Rhizobium aethiopicum]|uniref:Uncharacterized protein n=1 Tax=Rhizobium aethiopicum TaxID=1138170 RepID=A0A7W6Q989_9HYPH|nr:hypothetical protein [Rhizobium aethiopicum]MBB4192799.1 hypothetical protein [Rhizobium aethiopicum]
MDAAARSLVIATCLVMLAAVGYLAIGEYRSKYSSGAQTKALIERNQETRQRFDNAFGR